MFGMKRLCLIAVLAASFCGCTTNKNEPVGFARHPQVKSDRSARRTKGSTEAAEAPRILPETYYAAGRVAEQQGAPEKAIEHYRKAITVNHQYTAAYARLGLMYSVTGQHDKAVEAFENAVELKPRSAILRNNLGFELLYVERWDEAERHLRQATELDPNLAHAHINLGILLGRKGRYDQALASFQNVLSEADAYYNLGLLYRAQGRPADAAESFRHVLSIHPNFTAAQKHLVMAERLASSQTTRTQGPINVATTTAPIMQREFPSVFGGSPDTRTDQPTTMVDLGSLIEQIIPSQPAQPEVPTAIITNVTPTMLPRQVIDAAPTPAPISRESVSVTVDPSTEIIPVETITLGALPQQTIMPAPVKTIATSEPIRVPAFDPPSPTAKIERIEIKHEPIVEPSVVEPTAKMIPVIEPVVEERPVIRQDMPLAEMARIQQNAHNAQQKKELPVITGFMQPTDGPKGEEEVMLVLGESESMQRTVDDGTIVEPVLSRNTQNTLSTMDSMEKSLDIIRNEVECRRETGVGETGERSENTLPVQPPATLTAGEIIPISTSDSGFSASQPLTATAADSSVAYIQAVPVTTIEKNDQAEAAPGASHSGPAYYTPPKTTPRRVRPGQRR